MLSINGVSKTFMPGTANEKTALANISLTLNPGDWVTVIGSNGAGKSTLLNAIAGSILVDSGSIAVDGQDITRMPEHKRASMLGHVFQDPMKGTAPGMRIDENLAIAAHRGGKRRPFAWNLPKKECEGYIEMLKGLNLGLENRLTSEVGLLSGGQRQAITLLMATIFRPKVLLLDEHTAALDPKTAQKVLTLTQRIVETNGLTTLMITHNMNDAITYGNRLIMMDGGRIIYEASGEEKARLTVADLLAKFEACGNTLSDSMVLQKE